MFQFRKRLQGWRLKHLQQIKSLRESNAEWSFDHDVQHRRIEQLQCDLAVEKSKLFRAKAFVDAVGT